MTAEQPKIYSIAGCNGAGKTTTAMTVLPEILNCREFVNADEIARGLSPLDPDSQAIAAARLMLERMDRLVDSQVTFAFETTLATRMFAKKIPEWQVHGYLVHLIFIGLASVDVARERVAVATTYRKTLFGGDSYADWITLKASTSIWLITGTCTTTPVITRCS